MTMQTLPSLYERLKQKAGTGEWAVRILAEIGYLLELSRVNGNCYDEMLAAELHNLEDSLRLDGAITANAAKAAEDALSSLSEAAKSYELDCVAHAHIDMNWMWGYQETAAVTIDTFRTMLTLMKEYPEFTFSQSQASVYRIVEEHAPWMLPEIKQRVHEGRWELTASSWVENDKNMSGPEAMARHLLYTKRYLANLFSVPEDSLRLDFEPDTFGHSRHLPEVLRKGGVQYYYHCRGFEGDYIYNWRAPSGAEVLVYREPTWYLGSINFDDAKILPEFCTRYGIKHMLKVYGVGDHGGGPTRRDVERIQTMASWPLFPTVKCATFHEYFDRLWENRAQFPVVDQELNYIFTGCYTSQSRIKRANRMDEDRLGDAEALDALASSLLEQYKKAEGFEEAWRKVLFNQFHDILPGSGVVETREYALGEAQKALAAAGINATYSMNAIAQAIDTSGIEEDPLADEALGAGVGFSVGDRDRFRFPSSERGRGSKRVYTLFNTTASPRSDVTELTLWDWPEDPSRIAALDARGNELPCMVLETGNRYWGHSYIKLLVKADVPPMGYTACTVYSKQIPRSAPSLGGDFRCDSITDEPIRLENNLISAAFSPQSMKLVSLRNLDAPGSERILPGQPACGFQLVTEETSSGMTSWRVGRYALVEDLSETAPVTITGMTLSGLRKSISYTLPFRSSKLFVTVTLDEGSTLLRFAVKADWREFGSVTGGIPQLRFVSPIKDAFSISRCAIPFGYTDRPALEQDVPCTGWIAALEDGSAESAVLLSDCKYGFRGDGKALSVSLIRSSYDPDPTPEIGEHHFIVAYGYSADPAMESGLLQHPVTVCSTPIQKGTLPMEGSMLRMSGDLLLTGIKQAEDGNGLILHLANPAKELQEAVLTFPRPVCAKAVSLTEAPSKGDVSCTDCLLTVRIPAGEVLPVRVVLG